MKREAIQFERDSIGTAADGRGRKRRRNQPQQEGDDEEEENGGGDGKGYGQTNGAVSDHSTNYSPGPKNGIVDGTIGSRKKIGGGGQRIGGQQSPPDICADIIATLLDMEVCVCGQNLN